MVSVCLPSHALLQHLPSYLGFLTLDLGYLFMAAPAKRSHCSLPWTWGSSSQPCLHCRSLHARTLKDELPRLAGAQYATGEEWRNNSRKNEGMEPKQKQYSVVNVTGDRSKVRCCKEQYCIGTWNVRSVSQGKLEVVK